MKKATLERYVSLARRLGAKGAKVIPAGTVVTAPWVRMKCRFGCEGYGQCHTCPPYSPKPEETAALIKGYRRALLITGDGHAPVTRIASKIERQAFLDGCHKAYAMGAGPCEICRECDVKRPCRYPRRARPAMEASGIDVFTTARKNGFRIDVVKKEGDRERYFGLVLLE